MPILLKNLCEAIETITVKAQGHNNASDLKNMSDLSQMVTRKVIVPMKNHMKANDFMLGLHDPVLVGGNDFHENNGDLYIYIGQFEEKWRPRILGGVDHLLKSLGVITGTWNIHQYGSLSSEKHVVIPVIKLPTSDDPSPEILMSGGSLEKIKELTGLGHAFDDDEKGSFSLNIYVGELLDHINNYYDNFEKGLSPAPPNPSIRYYLQEMKNLCIWAKAHGIATIVAY